MQIYAMIDFGGLETHAYYAQTWDFDVDTTHGISIKYFVEASWV